MGGPGSTWPRACRNVSKPGCLVGVQPERGSRRCDGPARRASSACHGRRGVGVLAVGAAAAPRLPMALDRRADQLRRQLDADGRRAVAAPGRSQPSARRVAGAGREHRARDAAGAAGRCPRRLLRPTLAAVHRAGVLLRHRCRARRPHRRRRDASCAPPHVHLRARCGHSRAAADLAVGHPRARPQVRAPLCDPARDGRRQPVPRGRTGPGGSGHRLVGRVPGLRHERRIGDLPRRGPAVLATPAGCDRRTSRAVRARSPNRWPLRAPRARGAPDPVACGPVHRTCDGALGAASAGGARAAGARAPEATAHSSERSASARSSPR